MIVVILFPRIIVFKEIHCLNIFASNVVIPFPVETNSNDLELLNEPEPKTVTVFGISIDFTEDDQNTSALIVCKLFGNEIFSNE